MRTETNAIYEWTILVGANSVTIGIVSTTSELDLEHYVFSGSAHYYALGNGGRLEYRDNDIVTPNEDQYEEVQRTANGDVIKMTLDTKQRTLSFHKNGKDLGVAYDNIDAGGNYKLAASGYVWTGSEPYFIKLLDFDIMYIY